MSRNLPIRLGAMGFALALTLSACDFSAVEPNSEQPVNRNPVKEAITEAGLSGSSDTKAPGTGIFFLEDDTTRFEPDSVITP